MADKRDALPPAKSDATPSVFSLFDSMLRGWPNMPGFAAGEAPLTAARFDFAPRVETAETDKHYEVTVELPGVEQKDVQVTLDDDVLTIKGEKKAEREEKNKDYHVTERSYGAFQRAFSLPDNVEADKIAADFDKGVLKIVLPKAAAAAPKQKTIAIGKK
jgi:HSP20 family protein